MRRSSTNLGVASSKMGYHHKDQILPWESNLETFDALMHGPAVKSVSYSMVHLTMS